jgi:hypothetical protein
MKIIALIMALAFSSIGISYARTLIVVEQKTTKGCKIVNYENPDTKTKTLIRLEWNGKCRDTYADGPGTYIETYDNGDVSTTVGVLQRGKAEGNGKSETAKKDGSKAYFVGTFKSGMAYGQGEAIHVSAKGARIEYNGNFAAGLFQGLGKLKNPNWVYTGDFEEGKPHGRGKFEYSTKGVYEGGVRLGEPYGRGTLSFADGSRLIAEFSGDKLPTSGRIEYANGTKYEGELSNGINAHGRGRLTYIDGSAYVGEFRNGKPDGEGYAEYTDGLRLGVVASDGKIQRQVTRQQEPSAPTQAPEESLDDKWGRILDGVAGGILAAQPISNPQPAPKRPAAFLKGERISGFNKICFYDRVEGLEAVNMKHTDICPLTAP